MDISLDYKDLFRTLNGCRVKYLVVGAYAVILYTEPRYTKDIDIWADPSEENAVRLYKALSKYGAPLKGVDIADLTDEKMVYQIGVAPVRIDIMMGLPGLDFDEAWKSRKRSNYAGVPINVLGIKELIEAKKKAGRDQDILDIKKLTRKGNIK